MKIGLVLSGGVAKGAYHAGCLKAFKDRELKGITYVSGASIGVFGAYAQAADKIDLFCDLWKSIHFDTVADLAYSTWFNRFFRNIINELISVEDDLKLPMYAPICCLPFIKMEYGKLYGIYDKRWYNFLRGAAAYPVISGGVRFYRGQIAFDGGAMDNIPIRPLLKNEDPDLIIVLHFEADFRLRKEYLCYGVPILHFDVSSYDSNRSSSFDFHCDTISSRLSAGYDYGNRICDLIINNKDLDSVVKEFAVLREKEKNSTFNNVTFETWVQRLNSLFYPFISRRNIRVRNLYCEENNNKEFKENV